MRFKFLPKEAWIVKGKGESNTSRTNAWDNALLNSSIGNFNFVKYTSILPKNIKFRDFRKELIPGQEIKIISSVFYGERNDRITAGIGYGFINKCGLVIETGGKYKENELKIKLRNMLEEMAKNRKTKLTNVKIETNVLNVKKKFGCVFVGIIFNPNNYE